MRSVLLASLRVNARRYVAAALAVAIGVAFVMTTAAVSHAAREGLTAGVSAPYDGADAVASALGSRDADKLLAAARADGAKAAVIATTQVPLATPDGREVAEDADVGTITTDASLRWQHLVDGRVPSAPGEAALDADEAAANGVAIGDRLVLGTAREHTTVRVVGLVDAPTSLVDASVWLPWAGLRPLRDRVFVESVVWAGGGVAAATAAIHRVAPDATVTSRATYVEGLQQQVDNGVDAISTVMLLFAAIALVVAVLVVANTFSVLFAQRRRELALLRCVGATRRQLLGSIRLEALALGLAASVVGMAVGTLAGHGILALVGHLAPSVALGSASVSLVWYLAAAAVGVAVTLVASWLPTRTAVRVSPLAALRPASDVGLGTGAGRVRLGLGGALVVAGVGLLALAMQSASPLVMVAGGVVSFGGVLLLGPLLVPALVRVAGRPLGRVLGPPARLAAGNAVREPRRTATTAASLLIGVTLTTAVLTGLASGRTALQHELDRQHPVDAAVTASPDGTGALTPAVVDAVGATDDVERTATVPGSTGTLAGLGAVEVLAPGDAVDLSRGGDGSLRPAADQVWVPFSLADGMVIHRRTDLTVDGVTRSLRVHLGEGWGDGVLVAPATLDALTGGKPAGVGAVWVSAPDADADALGAALSAIGAEQRADVENGLSNRAYVDLQLDVLTAAVLALLGVALLIALVGIANTLGLSVLERRREHALLRALGLTRGQLRATLALESVLLSVVATLLGVAIGLGYAWVAVETLVRTVVPAVPMTLPVGPLLAVVAASAVAGLAASVLPARRAARTPPASGLALEQ